MTRMLVAIAISLPAWAGYSFTGSLAFPPASGTTTQTDITLAFTASDARLRTLINGGQIHNTVSRGGVIVPADFVLTADSTCGSVSGYSWGIESYSESSGTLIGWVKIPSLTTGSGLVVTVCIGNALVSSYQGGSIGAEFDGYTRTVYHFPDGTSLNASDFSPSANNASVNGAVAATGVIDGAALFNGTSAYVAGNSLTLNTTTTTVSAWVNIPSYPSVNSIVAGFVNGLGSDTYDKIIGINSSGKAFFYVYDGSQKTVTAPLSMSAGVWHFLAGTADGATARLYIDGALVSSLPAGQTFAGYSTPNLFVNGRSLAYSYLLSTEDEVEFDNVARTGDWIATKYNNQSQPPALSALSAVPAGTSNTRGQMSQGFIF